MTDGIGCKEFARIIGASYPEVSRAARAGLLRVVAIKPNRGGISVNILDREQARRIAAAVACGVPWRVAAALGERIGVDRRGGIRVKPLGAGERSSLSPPLGRSLRRSRKSARS